MNRWLPSWRQLAVGTGALLALVASLPGTATAATPKVDGPPRYELNANVPLLGTPKPYRLTFHEDPLGIPTTLEIDVLRHSTIKNHPEQGTAFQFSGPTMSCTSALGACTLSDAGTMGTFGHMNLAFSAAHPATVAPVTCNGVVTGHTTSRKGVLTGTLRLITGTTYFGTIRNGGSGTHTSASIPATATKSASNGKACGTGSSCVSSLDMFALGTDTFAIAERSQSSSLALLELTDQETTTNPDLTLQHHVLAHVPKAAFHVTSNSPDVLQEARIDYRTLEPFATGTATFAATNPPSTSGTSCVDTSREGTLTGPLTMQIDGYGPFTLTNSDAILEQEAKS
jgi:hypothetical protein